MAQQQEYQQTNRPLFEPISVNQTSVKIGAFGPQGSGKTTTLFLLALGLSLTYHDGAPIG
jgi:ABC-type iron transport system FetAB ATPase subunit